MIAHARAHITQPLQHGTINFHRIHSVIPNASFNLSTTTPPNTSCLCSSHQLYQIYVVYNEYYFPLSKHTNNSRKHRTNKSSQNPVPLTNCPQSMESSPPAPNPQTVSMLHTPPRSNFPPPYPRSSRISPIQSASVRSVVANHD